MLKFSQQGAFCAVCTNWSSSAANDSVFYMLYDMAEARMEQNVILPLLEIIEKECTGDKYDFYFLKMEPTFTFDFFDDNESDNNELTIPKLGQIFKAGDETGDKTIRFIREFVMRYRNKYFKKIKPDDSKLLTYLQNNLHYRLCQRIKGTDLLDDKEFYKIFKNTWIGILIKNIANFKDVLNKKKQECELDLDRLLLID